MKITLTNETKGMSVVFYEHKEFMNIFGYSGLYGSCYPIVTEQFKIFKMANPLGFFANNTVNPYVTNGVNEDGVNFKANSFGPRTISWDFTNVLVNPSGDPISPNQYLAILLLAKNDTLLVEVETTRKFSQYFYVEEGTNTELGIIELTTANGGEGISWSVGQIEQSYFFFSQNEPYIIKDLPQTLLNPTEYPFEIDVVSGGEVIPKYTLRTSGESGTWDIWKVQKKGTLQFFEYTNNDNDNTIIVDGNSGTVKNEFGDDRTANITAGNINLFLDAGRNTLVWTMNDDTNYDSASKYLPLDLEMKISFEAVVPVVE